MLLAVSSNFASRKMQSSEFFTIPSTHGICYIRLVSVVVTAREKKWEQTLADTDTDTYTTQTDCNNPPATHEGYVAGKSIGYTF